MCVVGESPFRMSGIIRSKFDWNNKDIAKLSRFSGISSLKSDSHLPKNLCCLLDWKPFRNDEKCFLFHLKSFFCSQDI